MFSQKVHYPCRDCQELIYFGDSRLSKNGKKIPLNNPDGLPPLPEKTVWSKKQCLVSRLIDSNFLWNISFLFQVVPLFHEGFWYINCFNVTIFVIITIIIRL